MIAPERKDFAGAYYPPTFMDPLTKYEDRYLLAPDCSSSDSLTLFKC